MPARITKIEIGDRFPMPLKDGFVIHKADVSGLLLVPNQSEFNGIFLTDSELRDFGYERIEAKTDAPGS